MCSDSVNMVMECVGLHQDGRKETIKSRWRDCWNDEQATIHIKKHANWNAKMKAIPPRTGQQEQ